MKNDKLFDFMTKIYSEMQETKQEMREGFKKVDERFDKVERNISKIQVTIENEIKPDIKASLEGYSLVYEKLEDLEEKVDALAERQSNQEVEIRVIKGNQKRKFK